MKTKAAPATTKIRAEPAVAKLSAAPAAAKVKAAPVGAKGTRQLKPKARINIDAKALPKDPWTAKLNVKKWPKRVRLETPFAGIAAGSMLYVGTPQIINDYLCRLRHGEVRTIERMRRELARKNQCDATCPVSTAIFLRIAAQASIEALDRGEPAASVAPFWRVIEPDSTIAKKLTVDSKWIEHMRALEAPSA